MKLGKTPDVTTREIQEKRNDHLEGTDKAVTTDQRSRLEKILLLPCTQIRSSGQALSQLFTRTSGRNRDAISRKRLESRVYRAFPSNSRNNFTPKPAPGNDAKSGAGCGEIKPSGAMLSATKKHFPGETHAPPSKPPDPERICHSFLRCQSGACAGLAGASRSRPQA